jgi:uncharacterized protein YndB with AHSA1/START domain
MKYIFTIFTLAFFISTGCNNNKTKTNKMNDNITFEINYTFKADPKRVFEMWTNPNSFSSWLGPDGAEMKFLSANVSEGGSSLWTMTTPDGLTKFGKINFKTIKPNELLIYSQNFSDKDGNFIKAPFSDSYPDSLLTTINFSQSGDTTNLKMKWEINGNATEQEKETFAGMKEIMKGGWTASFQKLDKLLKQNK